MSGRHTRPSTRAPEAWLTALCLLAVLAVLFSRVHPPVDVSPDGRSQAQALLRVLLAVVLAATALLGPGLVLRARWNRLSGLPLGLVPLPGVGLLVLIGTLTWVTARHVDPHDTAQVGVLAVVAATGATSWGAGPLVDHDEARTLGLAAVVLLFGAGRSLWSLGPEGELYAGSISRTTEVGDRPDSRISYHVTTLVAHGLAPYGSVSSGMFSPYTFLDRGPVPGIVSAPLMLAMGTTPSPALPDQPWSVFDVQGFMVYRVVMMLLALMALLAVFSLVHLVAGPARAHLATLVVATTPFVVHETWFTWPKLAASAMCLMAAHALIRRHAFAAGLLVGLGYLMHPLALLTAPTLLLLVLLLAGRMNDGWAKAVRRALVPGALLGLGVLIVFGVWRVANHGHPDNGDFFGYVMDADAHPAASVRDWISSRADSVANTLLPLYRLTDPHDPSINSIYAPSDATVHFFFQYWTGLPFGAGIVFFPPLVLGLLRASRRAPRTVLALVVFPFVVFAVYWGSFDSGLMREGLHPWVLTLLAVWATFWPGRPRDGRLGWPTRLVLAARGVELAAWAIGPSWVYHHALTGPGHGLGDVCALAAMGAAVAVLALFALRGTSTLQGLRVDVINDRRPFRLPRSRPGDVRPLGGISGA